MHYVETKTFKDKLRELMQERGVSFRQLAEGVGVSSAAVAGWVTGKTKRIFSDHLQRIAGFFNVPISYLTDDRATQWGFETLFFPIYESTFDVTGTGELGLVDKAPARGYSAAFMQLHGVEPYALHLFKAQDDSMTPVINEGDLVLFNALDTAITGNNKAYLIAIDETAYLRRVVKNIDGTLTVHAENPAYKEAIFPADKVRILGKLIERIVPFC